MMEYDELTDCMICPQLATDRDDALARVNELESLLCVEVNGGEFEPISSAYRPEGVMLVEAEIRRGHEAAAELAALKARRCDGCVWAKPLDASSLWVRGGHDMRRCDVQTQVEAPMLSDCTPRTAKWQEIVVRADHACNAWMAKEPTT
jgi:hypothetical protein